MKFNNTLPLLFFILTTTIVLAQDNEYKKNHTKAWELYNKGEFKNAFPYFIKAANLIPNSDDYYNAACAASLSKKINKGFKYLKLAMQNGFSDTTHLKKDTDLNNLKSDKRWAKTSAWLKEPPSNYMKEILKIHSCAADDLIPYEVDGKWGYLNKQTKRQVTKPIFDYANFVGKIGLVTIDKYLYYFSCSGEILSKVAQPKPSMDMFDDIHYPTPSDDLKKGFIVENNMITEYATQYGISFNRLKIYNDQHFAIIYKNEKYKLIDSTGNVRYDLKECTMLKFYNYGSDCTNSPLQKEDADGKFLIFFKDSIGKIGYLNNNLKVIYIPEATEFKEQNINILDCEYFNMILSNVYIQTNNKWGIWNCETNNWIIKPEYDDIITAERTFDSNYEKWTPLGNTIDYYFLVRQNNALFYIDLKNNKYIVK